MTVLTNPDLPSQRPSEAAAELAADAAAEDSLDHEPLADRGRGDVDAISGASGGSKRRWMVAGLGLASVAAAAAAGTVVVDSGGDASTVAEPIRLQAVTAETRDLVEYVELDGTMRYAEVDVVLGSVDGVVTRVVEAGSTLERGDTVVEINAEPITVAYGSTVLYRSMQEGAVGDDVLLLEQHLSALGHHVAEWDDDGNPVDEGFVVDGVFDEATTAAVLRWQAAIGAPPTGVVDAGDLVVVDGPALVTDVFVDAGDRSGATTPIVELSSVAVVADGVATNAGGEVVVIVEGGQPLASGDVLYAVDEVPRTVVVSESDIDRVLELGVEDGEDVLAIEQMLQSLGYEADGDLEVDETFDEATELAVTDWEEDLENTFDGLEPDGVIDPLDLVVVEPGTSVGTLLTDESAVLASGTTLWSSSSASATRIVETSIPVADQDQLALGDEVDVEFPDGELVVGTVDSIATSSTVDPMDPDAESRLVVHVSIESVPSAAESLTEVDVTVKLVDELAAGVVTVPASALVALGDGEFAVEQVVDGGTRFVAVETGMFSDGVVAVTGISAGTQVVVPS